MFLRSTNRRKDGKDHRYFSIVENRRLPGGKTAQRTVLYLGEINDQQQAAWRKTREVFDAAEQRFPSMSLFPDAREIPADAIDSMQVRVSGLTEAATRLRQWLAGLRTLAATGAGGVLATTTGCWPRIGELGKSAAAAGSESLARPGQRIPRASPVVPGLRQGRIAGNRLGGGGEGPPVPLSGPRART